MILVNCVKQTLEKISEETFEEMDYDFSNYADCVEPIVRITRGGGMDEWSFEMTHPESVRLRVSHRNERLGELIASFRIADTFSDNEGLTMDQISQFTSEMIEAYYE